MNGTSRAMKTAANHLFVWDNVTWADGANVVEAAATSAESTIKGSVVWMN